MIAAVIRRQITVRFDVKGSLERAFAAAEMNTDCATHAMGLKHPSQLSRQLQNLEHVSFQRLLAIDDPRFWISLLGDLAAHFGVDVSSEIGELRQDAMRLLLHLSKFSTRMVKAHLRAASARRQA